MIFKIVAGEKHSYGLYNILKHLKFLSKVYLSEEFHFEIFENDQTLICGDVTTRDFKFYYHISIEVSRIFKNFKV